MADNLPPLCADVKKSGGLNLLEPCGPVQPCNGTALPFYLLSANGPLRYMQRAKIMQVGTTLF
jgi:hypothetical protein